MKTIYKSLMAFAAALLLVPSAKAQEPQYILDPTSGFAINKYVKDRNPDENGEYTLRIETFATGEVTVQKKSIPSDIVLVLDGSGSMSSNKVWHETMRVARGSTVRYSYSTGFGSGKTSSAFWIKYPDNAEGELCRVYHGHADIDGDGTYDDHWLYFDDANGVTHYLNYDGTSSSISTEKPAPGTYPLESSYIYRGVLYSCPQRNELLKVAVNNFIDLIKQNDEEEVQPYLAAGQTGNQIAIVLFRGDDSPLLFSDLDNLEAALNGTGATYCKALSNFKPVNEAANVTALKTAVNNMPAAGNTPIDTGMKLAEVLVHNLEKTMPAYVGTTQQRLKTVVMFTDGSPTVSNNTRLSVELPDGTIMTDAPNGQRNNIVTYNSMRIGYDLKHTYHTNVFSIGFGASGSTLTFLQRLSSNYPDASMIPNAANTTFTTYTGTSNPLPADKQIYFKDAAVDGMENIFQAIAESVGGGGSSEYDNTPLVAVDMVSSSFQLPANADASRVKVFTAQCIGTTGETFTVDGKTHNVLAFADPIEYKSRDEVYYWASSPVVDADGNPELDELGNPKYEWTKVTADIDEAIVPTVDTGTNTVTVGGFDYEALWCGLDPEHENQEQYDSADYPDTYVQGYRGFKIIIEFPIVVKDGATGGPKVVTNLSSSGVYQTDDQGQKTGLPIVEYPLPDLPIPINLVIEKHGLLAGESATFTILKKEVNPDDPNNNPYIPFNRVTLTGTEDGSPAVERLLNLDPSFYYKIWEEGWAWSYTNQAQDLESAPSTETVTDNKFVINNEKTDTEIKHAEAAKRNVMEKTTSSTTTP